MNIIERILLALYSVILSLFSMFIIILPLNLLSLDSVFKESYYNAYISNNYLISIIGLVLLILSLEILFSGIVKKRNKNSFIYPTKLGEVRISAKTIEGLVKCVTSRNSCITNINVKIKFIKGDIQIYLKGLVDFETDIPKTAIDVQEDIKEYIETYTGLKVEKIKIDINDISSSKKVLS